MTHVLAVESASAGGKGVRLSLDQLQALALAATERGLGAGHTSVDPTLKIAFSAAIVDLFWVAEAIAVLGLIAILLTPELPLASRHHPEPVAEPGEEFIKPDEVEEPARS
jgi:hypothetical protein